MLLSASPCFAALSVVQQSISAAGTGAPISVTMGSQPVAGNIIHILCQCYQGSGGNFGGENVTDNQSGNTYAIDVQKDGVDTHAQSLIFSGKVVGSSGTFILTYSATITTLFGFVSAIEVSGEVSSSWLDQIGSDEVTTGSTQTVTASGANSQADEIVFAVSTCASATFICSSAATTGYTSITGSNDAMAFKIISAGETSSATFAFAATTDSVGVLSTNKASGGGGGAVIHGCLTMLGVSGC